jgi:hypothetical protein
MIIGVVSRIQLRFPYIGNGILGTEVFLLALGTSYMGSTDCEKFLERVPAE